VGCRAFILYSGSSLNRVSRPQRPSSFRNHQDALERAVDQAQWRGQRLGQCRIPGCCKGDREEASYPGRHHYRRTSRRTFRALFFFFFFFLTRLTRGPCQVCTAFLALSLRDEGYTVFANSDASGTFNVKTAQEANDRMRAAGVHVLSLFAVACELMRDWRNSPGQKEMLPFFDQ
jgi:hypothetical protein